MPNVVFLFTILEGETVADLKAYLDGVDASNVEWYYFR